MKYITRKLRKVPQYVWVLILIILLGTFLRTYHFHDWLRFNMDQGRDALLVSRVVNGSSPFPLLGPRASGTQFKLGPIFYYFQIISVKLFGNYPDKMAYPDLISSILCIPLFFFFLRKYFDTKISLSVTAIFSVSFFIIRYSRYAWNPNSTPFWTILSLYGLHSLLISRNRSKKMFWAVISGISIGIVIQLHTISLVFFSVIIGVVFGYLCIKKKKLLKYILMIVVLSIICNIPQFIHEFQTHGQNSKEFIKGVTAQSQKTTIWSEAIIHNSICWVENNIYAISGYNISDSCKLEINYKHQLDIVIFIVGVIFFLGGVFLSMKYLREEKDQNKKVFLALVFFYMIIAYILGIFLADKLGMRYFLMMMLFPFIFIGFWMKFLLKKIHNHHKYFVFTVVFLLVISNIFFVVKSFINVASYEKCKHIHNTIENVTLKEIEGISNFIVANQNGAKVIYLDGKRQFVKKTFNSIKFLVEKSNIILLSYKKSGSPQQGHIFYLTKRDSRRRRRIIRNANPPIKYNLSGRFLIYIKK